MNTQKLVLHSFLHAVGSAVYVLLVGWFLYNGENLFGQMEGFLSISLILLLLVISSSIMGILFLLGP